jgi:hypothetical protein
MKLPAVLLAASFSATVPAALAQSSPTYELDEHVLNEGGSPAGGVAPASSGFRMTLGSLGETLGPRTISGASYQLLGGFVSPFSPPGEVTGLGFTGPATLIWDPEPSVGAYDFYRGDLGLPGSGACLDPDLTATSAMDTDPLPSMGGYFYLVTAENTLNQEGTAGFRTDGTQRAPAACP